MRFAAASSMQRMDLTASVHRLLIDGDCVVAGYQTCSRFCNAFMAIHGHGRRTLSRRHRRVGAGYQLLLRQLVHLPEDTCRRWRQRELLGSWATALINAVVEPTTSAYCSTSSGDSSTAAFAAFEPLQGKPLNSSWTTQLPSHNRDVGAGLLPHVVAEVPVRCPGSFAAFGYRCPDDRQGDAGCHHPVGARLTAALVFVLHDHSAVRGHRRRR